MATVNYQRIYWEDLPERTTPVNAENLNKMDEGIAGLYHDLESVDFTEIQVRLNEIMAALSREVYVFTTDGQGNVFYGPSVVSG